MTVKQLSRIKVEHGLTASSGPSAMLVQRWFWRKPGRGLHPESEHFSGCESRRAEQSKETKAWNMRSVHIMKPSRLR